MARKKKKQQPVRDYLQRPASHVTDEQARRYFTNHTPPDWVSNPLNGDYGKDYHIELTRDGGRVDRAFYAQLKGTRHCKYTDGGMTVSFPLERKYLAHYAAEAKLPVFLVVVDLEAGKGFWLFTQEYLVQHVDWAKKASSTLRIPTTNRLEDTSALTQAIRRALDWMVEAQQKPVRDRVVNDLICKLQAKDSRYRVEASFSEEMERLRLIPKEPVNLRFHVRPKKKQVQAQMASDFFDRGLPVEFEAGELVVEGSALIHDLAAPGGTFQLCARALRQVSEEEWNEFLATKEEGRM